MAIEIPSPRDAKYWDRGALVEEERRVFEICNGCRLCWNLCPSFPALFDAVDALDVDEEPDPDASGTPSQHQEADSLGNHASLTDSDHAAPPRSDILGQAEALERLPLAVHDDVARLCYQCKLCDPICPYTPPHEFGVDFPRLMLRRKAIDAREEGVSIQDRFLGDPDLVGRIGTLTPRVANLANGLAPIRWMMEKTLGVHRKRQLPEFAPQTFQQWFKKRHPAQLPPEEVEGPKVVLFYTCTVQWNAPHIGRAAVEVLEHNGITVYAPEMRCCGMPALDGGDVPRATRWAQQNVDILTPFVEAGCEVVSPGPTCSYMMKQEWHDYLGTEAARQISEHSHDLMEYLFKLRKAKKLRTDATVALGEVNYHLPCHLKVQKIGYRSRDVLKRLEGTTVKMVDRCSCMDGTWGMKKEFYELSTLGASKLVDEMRGDKGQTLASDCLIAHLQIEENTGQPVVHPIELLWKAYGGSETTPLPPGPPRTGPEER